jgi:predicted Zn-dependent protease
VIEGELGEGGRLPMTGLADAQALYAKALKQDPGLLEARLRLGRVLLLRGRPREALPELERVGRESPRPAQCYMARMFEGRTRERLGDPRGAAAAFAAAVERVPRGQSALVALGRALDRLGEGTRAQEAFDRALQAEVQRDPWLDYIKGQPDRIDALLEELRRLVP